MRVTLDFPGDLFELTESAAERERLTFNEMVTRALSAALSGGADAQMQEERTERLLAALNSGSPAANRIGRFNREEIYDRPILR